MANNKKERKSYQFRECRNLIDDIIAKGLSRQGVTEDDLIGTIDTKYKILPHDILILKGQGVPKKEIMKILGIGEVSYGKALKQLKEMGRI